MSRQQQILRKEERILEAERKQMIADRWKLIEGWEDLIKQSRAQARHYWILTILWGLYLVMSVWGLFA